MSKEKVQYGVWEEDYDNDPDSGHWNLFDHKEDAVSSLDSPTEVFEFVPRSLGTFVRKVVLEKVEKKPVRKSKKKK